MSTQPQVELARLALAALPPEARERLIREHSPRDDDDGASVRTFTIAASAKAVGVSRGTVYRAIEAGALAPVRLVAGGNPRLRACDVAAWIGARR